MFTFLALALAAPALQTVVNFTDKYMLEGHVPDARGMFMFSALVGLVLGSGLWVVTGCPILPMHDAVLVMLTGVCFSWATAIYYRVMQAEDASRVIFLSQLVPVFVLLLSFAILGEQLHAREAAGFVVIIAAALLIALDGRSLRGTVGRTLLLMCAFDLLWAGANVLFKCASDAQSFVKLVSYESWGWALGGFALLALSRSSRAAFIATARGSGRSVLVCAVFNELVYVGSKFASFLAISLGPVALVSVLNGTQALFGTIYGCLLTMAAPRIFREDIGRAGVLKKLGCSVAMVGGIMLIA